MKGVGHSNDMIHIKYDSEVHSGYSEFIDYNFSNTAKLDESYNFLFHYKNFDAKMS